MRIWRHPKFSLSLALAVSAAAFLMILVALATPGKESRREQFVYVPAVDDKVSGDLWARNFQPLSLDSSADSDGVRRHSAVFATTRLRDLVGARDIRIDFSPLPAECEVVDARLLFESADGKSQHAFGLESREDDSGKTRLRFTPPAESGSFDGQKGRVLLEVTTRGVESVGVLSQLAEREPYSNWLWAETALDGEQVFSSIYGSLRFKRDGSARYSRADLLAHTWGLTVRGSGLIYAAVAVAALLWLAGCCLLLWCDPASRGLWVASAIGLPALGLCMLWAVLVPPWHGPDEPDHYLTFAEVNGASHLASSALELANLGHFHRLLKRINERFTVPDVSASREDGWAYYIAAVPPDRSALGTVLWKHFPSPTASEAVGTSVLLLRLGNGAVVCSLVAFALAAAWRPSGGDARLLCFGAPIVALPTVTFHAVMISNYVYLTAGFLIQAVAFGLVWTAARNGPDPFVLRRAGFLCGLGLATALSAAENALVVLPFWLLVLCGLFMLRGDGGPTNYHRLIRAFFVPLSIAVLGFVLVLTAVSPDGTWLPGRLADLLASVTMLAPMPASVLFAGFLILLLWVPCYFAGLFSRSSIFRNGLGAWRGVSRIILVLAVLTALLLPKIDVPELTLSERPVGPTEYTSKAVVAFVQSLGPRSPDVFVSRSFWSKLAWQDLQLPMVSSDLLRWFTGLGLLSLLFMTTLPRSAAEQSLMAWISVAAVLVSVAAIALMYHSADINVHGRYLLAPYIFSFTLAFIGVERLVRLMNSRVIARKTWIALLVSSSVIVQSSALLAAIHRYF